MTNTLSTEDTQTITVRPFEVAIPQDALDDLQARLENTRFATEAPGDGWEHGAPVSYLRDMVDYWKSSFD